jgi:DNA primase
MQARRSRASRSPIPTALIYPDQGISKIQLARYYESVADWIVPHVKSRPLSLVHARRASPPLERAQGARPLTSGLAP